MSEDSAAPGRSLRAGRPSVAVEVSGLAGGDHEQQALIDFVLAAIGAESLDAMTWSTRWLHRPDRTRGVAREARSWLVARTSVLGVTPRISWAVPRAQVVLLASGPLNFRVDRPGIVTLDDVGGLVRAAAAAGTASKRIVELLRRAAGEGVVMHAISQTAGDLAVSALGLDRSSVVVALPGLVASSNAPDAGSPSVGVVAGMNHTLDRAIVDAANARGVPAELIDASGVSTSRPCVVIASPRDGFPFAAIEAMARSTPVVIARTPTTTELLEGAAILVDEATPAEFSDAAVSLATNDAMHGLQVAAGGARASDFSLDRRGPELVAVLHRALASR